MSSFDRREVLKITLAHLAFSWSWWGCSKESGTGGVGLTAGTPTLGVPDYDQFIRDIHPENVASAATLRQTYDLNAGSVFKLYNLKANEISALYYFDTLGSIISLIKDSQLKQDVAGWGAFLKNEFTTATLGRQLANDVKATTEPVCANKITEEVGGGIPQVKYPHPKAEIFDIQDDAGSSLGHLTAGAQNKIRVVAQGIAVGGSALEVALYKGPNKLASTQIAADAVSGTYRCGCIKATLDLSSVTAAQNCTLDVSQTIASLGETATVAVEKKIDVQ